jgi:hypothetical protein
MESIEEAFSGTRNSKRRKNNHRKLFKISSLNSLSPFITENVVEWPAANIVYTYVEREENGTKLKDSVQYSFTGVNNNKNSIYQLWGKQWKVKSMQCAGCHKCPTEDCNVCAKNRKELQCCPVHDCLLIKVKCTVRFYYGECINSRERFLYTSYSHNHGKTKPWKGKNLLFHFY